MEEADRGRRPGEAPARSAEAPDARLLSTPARRTRIRRNDDGDASHGKNDPCRRPNIEAGLHDPPPICARLSTAGTGTAP